MVLGLEPYEVAARRAMFVGSCSEWSRAKACFEHDPSGNSKARNPYAIPTTPLYYLNMINIEIKEVRQ